MSSFSPPVPPFSPGARRLRAGLRPLSRCAGPAAHRRGAQPRHRSLVRVLRQPRGPAASPGAPAPRRAGGCAAPLPLLVRICGAAGGAGLCIPPSEGKGAKMRISPSAPPTLLIGEAAQGGRTAQGGPRRLRGNEGEFYRGMRGRPRPR